MKSSTKYKTLLLSMILTTWGSASLFAQFQKEWQYLFGGPNTLYFFQAYSTDTSVFLYYPISNGGIASSRIEYFAKNGEVSKFVEIEDIGFVKILPDSASGFTGLGYYGNNKANIVKLDQNLEFAWSDTIEFNVNTIPFYICSTIEGGYFVFIESYATGGGGYEYWILKVGAEGIIKDTSEIIQAYPDVFRFWDITSHPETGDLFCYGSVDSSGDQNYAAMVMAFNDSLDFNWMSLFQGPFNFGGYFKKGVPVPGGGFTVAGEMHFGIDAADIWIAGFDSQGNETWRDYLYGPDNNAFTDMESDSAGNVYVCGNMRTSPITNYSPTSLMDIVTLKYSPEGVRLWERYFGYGDYIWDAATDMCMDDSGYVYVFGAGDDPPTWAVIKYNPEGDLVADYRIPFVDSVHEAQPMEILVDKQYNIYLTGYDYKVNDTDRSGILLKYSQFGTTTSTTEVSTAVHDLLVYPNPAEGYFHVENNHPGRKPWSMELYGIDGRLLMHQAQISSASVRVSTETLPAGVYMLRVQEGGRTLSKRVAVR